MVQTRGRADRTQEEERLPFKGPASCSASPTAGPSQTRKGGPEVGTDMCRGTNGTHPLPSRRASVRSHWGRSSGQVGQTQAREPRHASQQTRRTIVSQRAALLCAHTTEYRRAA